MDRRLNACGFSIETIAAEYETDAALTEAGMDMADPYFLAALAAEDAQRALDYEAAAETPQPDGAERRIYAWAQTIDTADGGDTIRIPGIHHAGSGPESAAIVVSREDVPVLAAMLAEAQPTDPEVPSTCPGYETTPNRCRCGCEGCKHHCGAHDPSTLTGDEETDEERADRQEAERDHARGDHTHCGITCETEMPTEHLRNFVIAKGYPGTKGALDELLRRARAAAA